MPEPLDAPFEPRRPTLAATGVLSVWILILSLPMWAGRFLAGPFSDQYATGYAFRHWAAEQWRATGRVPLWNAELFGGMPFVAAMHGDIFYPTAWLRLVLPTELAMNLGFAAHYVLAGVFLYLLLRALRVSWTGAVAGGFAYQLSGVIGSYVAPGHDGKLFVTALLPLMLLALVRAMRDGKVEAYFLLALAVGLGVLSPHPQMLYYALVASGLFAIFLAFGREDRPGPRAGALQLAGALGAVLLGVGIGLIQLLPFYQYIPFSPRADTYRGFEGATSYAIPWSHIPEFFFARFTGSSQAGTYWAANPIKLHSEYLGLPVIALAMLGVFDRERRRLVLWLAGIGLLFLLVALGAGTPFYRLWYGVMPFMKQVRAPGMALYVVTLILAMWAAFGVQRLERGVVGRADVAMLAAGGLAALVAASGMLGAMAETLAQGIQMETPVGRPVAQIAREAQGAIRGAGFLSGLALVLLGGLVWLRARGKVPVVAFAAGLLVIVSADLWRNAQAFWVYSDAPDELFAPDAVTELLRGVPRPYRVLDFSGTDLEVYPGSALMAFGIPQALGHHGNELHRYDELLGGKNAWRHLLSPAVWDLLAIRYMILPAGAARGDAGLAGFNERYSPLMTDVMTSAGVSADLFVRRDPVPYARLIPAAVKAPDQQAIQAIVTGRVDFARLLLLGEEASVDPAPIREVPPAFTSAISVTAWAPGRMTLEIPTGAPADAWVLVSENWYPEWRAAVDGRPVEPVRGNVSLIALPVPAGAREITLRYESAPYRTGKALSLGALALVGLGLVVPGIARRVRRD